MTAEVKPMFAPHKYSQDELRALKQDVLVCDMDFDVRITQSGLILANDNGTTLGIRPRWGRVYAVGDQQKHVRVGQWIMVAHGRWTRGIELEENGKKVTIRKIDPKDILLVSDREEAPQDMTWSSAYHVQKQTR